MKYKYSQLGANRIFGLDLIRSISVCAVVFAHSGYDHINGFKYGIVAIEYFFVMSGFLVGEMLIKEFKNGSTFKTLFNFWIMRWFRTLPLYYLILFLMIIFSQPFIGLKAWPYLFFLQNNIGGISFFAVSWTLVIEEWFYIIMPLIIFVFFKKGIGRNRFMVFSILVIVLDNIFRMLYVAYKDVSWGGIVGSFPFRLDSFMIGVIIAFIKIEYNHIFNFLARPRTFALLALLFAGYVVLYAHYNGGDQDSKVYWTRTIGFSLTSFVLALQLPFLNNSVFLNGISDKNIFRQVLTWLSLLSYPIYLIHMKFLSFVKLDNDVLRLTVTYILIIIASYFLLVFFSQPVTSSRKKFLIK